MNCHGCEGRGWVDSKVIGPALCPVCKGDGAPRKEKAKKTTYDQDSIWTKIVSDTPDGLNLKLRDEAVGIDERIESGEGSNVLVHLLFDKDITPQGNLIFYHLQHQTITGPKQTKISQDEIISRGYDINEDGEIKTWNDVPISPAVSGLIDWCQNSSLLHSFEIDANRKGNPCFCDERMMAMVISPRGPQTYDVVGEMIDFLYEKHYLKTLNLHLHLLA